MPDCPFCSKEIPPEQLPHEKSRLYACGGCLNPVALLLEETGVVSKPVRGVRDVRQVAPDGSIGGAILAGMDRAIENLPVLPEISQKVLQMVNDPEISMGDLAEVIQKDQVIALQIMKLANSATYGGLQEIAELNAACARLGMKVIANAVQAVANGNLYITGEKDLQNYMQRLWRHAIATAHAASAIAVQLAMPRSEALFLAGLIHDIGKVVLLEILTGAYSGPLAPLREAADLRAEVFDKFHNLVGLHVAQKWELPPEFLVTTFCHHDASTMPDNSYMPMTQVVALADAVARAEGYGSTEDEEIFLTSHPASQFLNMSDIKLAAMRIDLKDKVEALLDMAA